jgi:HD-GYP domain-containing protein (c-di-GMP phosphodiesterase class II)
MQFHTSYEPHRQKQLEEQRKAQEEQKRKLLAEKGPKPPARRKRAPKAEPVEAQPSPENISVAGENAEQPAAPNRNNLNFSSMPMNEVRSPVRAPSGGKLASFRVTPTRLSPDPGDEEAEQDVPQESAPSPVRKTRKKIIEIAKKVVPYHKPAGPKLSFNKMMQQEYQYIAAEPTEPYAEPVADTEPAPLLERRPLNPTEETARPAHPPEPGPKSGGLSLSSLGSRVEAPAAPAEQPSPQQSAAAFTITHKKDVVYATMDELALAEAMAAARDIYRRSLEATAALEERLMQEGHEADIQEEEFFSLSREIAAQYAKGNSDALFLCATEDASYEHHIHVVHVALLSIYLAAASKLSENEQIFIGVAAFLQDIGIVRYKNIITKPGALLDLERSMLRKHPIDGANMVRTLTSMTSETASELGNLIMETHESYDGSGYPNKKKGSAISPYAQLIKVSDIYQALTHVRPWRPSFTPLEALHMLLGARHTFSHRALRTLLNSITLYPHGAKLRLSTGEEGIVLRPNRLSMMRPVLKITGDEAGNKIDGAYMDLDKNASVSISGVAFSPQNLSQQTA